ncbi:MAG: M15 family metallopeptidase [Deltaproteobacteria bacterium]|nr:M15 family metallopeptidase [Deltaproteobacteria bacterium]MBW2659091.1 M15 family metallopeptidase [Deltaproteobacteria bacterium]
MKRRTFLKYAVLAAMTNPLEVLAAVSGGHSGKGKSQLRQLKVHPLELPGKASRVLGDAHVKDYLTKVRHPNVPHKNDIILRLDQIQVLGLVVAKFDKIQSTVGHGNFCILGFGEALRIAGEFPEIGKFIRQELDFLEMIYHRNAEDYGFKGKKMLVTLTQTINKEDVFKVPYSGNYLFNGESLKKYERVKEDLGPDLVLTSGIRGIPKQFLLFLNKAHHHGGNLSLASRSLAPPGYSYHATGDFDVGQKGFGSGNFSEQFITTPVFKMLASEGFVKCRYKRDNMLGVRYEPWHVKL